MGKLVDFLEERLGLASAWRSFASARVRGGARPRHVFPAVLAYLLVQQAVLGVVLSLYYSPSATDAWASTAYIQDQVTMGWFVRGLHYHGASAMVIVSALWVAVMAFGRAYRRPWEAQWIAGLGLLAVSLGLGLTGNPLPWDQEGYWSIGVELSVAEQAPAGEAIKTVVQGGSELGNLSVLRLWVIHAFLLPGAFVALLAVVIAALRRSGPPPPGHMSEGEADRTAQPYFPSQAFFDVLAMTLVAGALVGLTVSTHGAELLAPADPTENFQARPAWYFLFLYKLRMFFEGPMEPVATMVIPGAAASFLVAAPVLERMLGEKLGARLVKAGTAALGVGVVGLTAYGVRSDRADEEYQEAVQAAHESAERARGFAREGVVPLGGPAVFFNDPQYQVKQLFEEHCGTCHSVDGLGGEDGPDLSDYGSREWLRGAIRDVNAPRYLGNTPHKDEMTAYPETCPEGDDDCIAVSQAQLLATVEYLLSLQGDFPGELDAALVKEGASAWENDLECNNCHEVEKGSDVGDGPNMHGRGSKAWMTSVIRDSSHVLLYGDDAEMPEFAPSKLADEEVAQLVAFIRGDDAVSQGEGDTSEESAEQ